MKPLDKIERLAEIADSINFHERQLKALHKRKERNEELGFTSYAYFNECMEAYNRLLRILELKYNRVLTEIK